VSKLHVKQLEGYLAAKLTGIVNMDDYANQIRKAFLTRALGALAVSHLAEVSLQELAPYITDGSKDGGIVDHLCATG